MMRIRGFHGGSRRNHGRFAMRRFTVSLVVVMVLSGLTTIGGLRTSAQEATPAAGPNLTVGHLAPIGVPFEPLPGVELTFLNEGQPTAAPGQSLIVYRIIFHGGEAPSHIHPGTTVGTVESGTFAWTLLAGTVWVTRLGAAPEQVTEPGTELILQPGESLFYNADVVHTAGAAGDEPASVLVAALFEVGQPFLTLTDEHGTPTP
jgi:quercetin dioxygenase-like cupin family protein